MMKVKLYDANGNVMSWEQVGKMDLWNDAIGQACTAAVHRNRHRKRKTTV